MISAYEDWYIRRNWYALAISICTNKGAGTALRQMGITSGHEEKPEFRHYRKYTDDTAVRVVQMKDSGADWGEISETLNIKYGSLFHLYKKTKRRIETGELSK